jgi:hypothetical protein
MIFDKNTLYGVAHSAVVFLSVAALLVLTSAIVRGFLALV